MTDLEFVNDWSELEDAVHAVVAEMHDPASCEFGDECEWIDNPFAPELKTFAEYVPRLLTQYASLVELSFALTEGWEQYATLNAPSGLYVPDNR